MVLLRQFKGASTLQDKMYRNDKRADFRDQEIENAGKSDRNTGVNLWTREDFCGMNLNIERKEESCK
jgi:hypothetical protein